MFKDTTLEAHIKNNCVAPAYLLVDRDILKLKEIAKWFSSGFNTADVFNLGGNPNILVKETEEFIARAHLAAVGGKKLFIICDAATMTPQAQNKTLKTIEDVPANTTFMLLASSDAPILNTIKSRCVTIYPDPIVPSLTETALYESNQNTEQIFSAAEKILTQCKSLDDALPHIPTLTKKENIAISLTAINRCLSLDTCCLSYQKKCAIMNCLAIINRNIDAGCNATNAFDILLMELFCK